MISRRLVILMLLVAASARGSDVQVPEGLWIHHDAWQFAPAEINEDGDIHRYANAALVNFCPDGEFRLATGTIYVSTKSLIAGIGASDGLTIYRGIWWHDGDSLVAEYRLVSAEIRRINGEDEKNILHQIEIHAAGTQFEFPFVTRTGETYPLKLMPAKGFEKELNDRFVECSSRHY